MIDWQLLWGLHEAIGRARRVAAAKLVARVADAAVVIAVTLPALADTVAGAAALELIGAARVWQHSSKVT